MMSSLMASQQLPADAQTSCLSSSNVLTLNVGGHIYKATVANLLCSAAAGSKLAEIAKLHCQVQVQHTSKNSCSTACILADSFQDSSQESHADVDDTEGSCGKGTPDDVIYPATAAANAVADICNRDGVVFAHIMDYLADGGHLVPPDDSSTCQQLLKEAEYYCLGGLVDLLKQHLASLSKPEAGGLCRAELNEPDADQKPWKQGRLQKVAQGMLELRQLQQRLHEQLSQQRTKQQQMYNQLQQQRLMLEIVKQDISSMRSAVA